VTGGIRVALRVRPGAPRDHVGGRYGDGQLMVSVRAPAVDGKATEAARRALARALGVKAAAVTIVSGATHRNKVLDVAGDPSSLLARLGDLLDG
jgi:uncharacterized protein YggU (UPF0235/DUF167 family)